MGSISALDFCLIEAGPGAGSSHSGCRLRRAAFMRLIGQLPRAAPSGCWGPQEPITPTWTRDDYTTTNPKVAQRDVPGIDSSYLAMDSEEGFEVVWNEVQFSERKNFKAQEAKIRLVFENLIQLEHPNIVKFHKYWTDTHNEKPRVIFITEYMSSGSLKQFLKRTKRNVKKLPLQAWKRWSTQILSALNYLHSCSPPIVHGNLTCDTIFIQHNGLVKIGSVAPDTIHHHVKTCREKMKNMHFIAPDYSADPTPAVDIYAFGMCALEMAALEIQGNGDSGTLVTEEHIKRTIESLDDPAQKDLITKCLSRDGDQRPTARELLFHPVLFEVHSLKLLAADAYVNSTANTTDSITDEIVQRMMYSNDAVLAEIVRPEGQPSVQFKMGDAPVSEKLEKFVEDVKYGIYPLTAYKSRQQVPPLQRPLTPEVESVKSASPEPVDIEARRVVNMMCNVKPKDQANCDLMMTILLRMDDKMNRQLTCFVSDIDDSLVLAQELVYFGFINEADKDKIKLLIEESLKSTGLRSHSSSLSLVDGSTASLTTAHHGTNGMTATCATQATAQSPHSPIAPPQTTS
ncbi:protein kinase activity [Nesidiocoris tenuis]|uniref:Protein kinase activity n=1 Tax=Nesidiocoris tenuis TaxID=355587 RepID=A0ABN7ATZ4_9HEMI|nr:protein kinase activity [Nesidiocoris tenuis]